MCEHLLPVEDWEWTEFLHDKNPEMKKSIIGLFIG